MGLSLTDPGIQAAGNADQHVGTSSYAVQEVFRG